MTSARGMLDDAEYRQLVTCLSTALAIVEGRRSAHRLAEVDPTSRLRGPTEALGGGAHVLVALSQRCALVLSPRFGRALTASLYVDLCSCNLLCQPHSTSGLNLYEYCCKRSRRRPGTGNQVSPQRMA